jgi:transposase InsO family protein
MTERNKEIAATRVRYGYRRIHVLLRREGWRVNAKRVYRLYREMGLQLRHKTPKRRVKAKLREDAAQRRDRTRPGQWTLCTTSWRPGRSCACAHLRGETRSEGKLLSLFEPTTEIIRKGRGRKLTAKRLQLK